MNTNKFVLAAFGLVLSLATSAEAKVFSNAYLSFQLADRWSCNLEQTEFVCRTNQPGLAEAIIIFTAKEVGPQDSLASYQTHLKAPRTIMSRAGSPVQSTVYKVEQRNINNHPWIDGMHLSSEVANYYTRYVATTKEKIAVLVTFSAHRTHYSKYSSDFFKSIESLQVIATRALMNNRAGGAGGDGLIGTSGGEGAYADPNLPPEDGGGGGAGAMGDKTRSLLALLFVAGAVGAYLLIKRGKGSKSGKKRRR